MPQTGQIPIISLFKTRNKEPQSANQIRACPVVKETVGGLLI